MPRAWPRHRSRTPPCGPKRPRCPRIALPSPRRCPAASGRSRSTAGQAVEKGETLVIMEAMKMEIAVVADCAGTVVSIHGKPERGASAGDTLLLVAPGAPMSLDLTISFALEARIGQAPDAAGSWSEALIAERANTPPHNIWISEVDDACLARTRARPCGGGPRVAAAVRHPVRHQGQHRLRGPADHRGLPGVRLSTPRTRRRWCRR